MDTTAPGRVYFNTDALPERDRFPAYCEEMIRRYAALDIVARNNVANFRASIELQRTGGVDIGYITTTPSDYERTQPYLRDGDDALCIVLCVEGGSYQTQRGDPQKLRAGEGIVCDNAQTGGIHVEGNSRFWVIKAARPSIGSLVPRTARFGGAKLDRDPVARRLLFGYLDAAHEIDFGREGRTRTIYDQHIVDLIALALGAEADVRREAEDRGICSVRRDAILREIDRRRGDHAFGVNAVAASLGITPRYVHLLLEETGQSFTHHLLQRRLEAAAALLRNPQWRHRKIADIAGEAGFTDLSYFNRAFRRHFGSTPSDIRQTADRLS
jgi:AraC-like DNA-binding protein